MEFERLVVWQQVKVAPSNNTYNKNNKRVFECVCSIGAPPEELHTARLPRGQLRFPRSRGSGPKGSMPGFDPGTLGRSWPQEAPKWGPRASLEEPLGAQKTLKTNGL